MTKEEIKKHAEDAARSILAGAGNLERRVIHTNWLYVLIGGFALVLFLWLGISSYYSWKLDLKDAEAKDKDAKIAEVQKKAEEQQRVQSEKERAAQLQESMRTVASLIAQQNAIVKRSLERDTRTQAQITEVSAPNRPVEQIANDSADVLGAKPQILPAGLLYTPAEVQQFVATRLDRDRLAAKVKDVSDELGKEQQKTAQFSQDLDRCNQAVETANQMVKDYQALIAEKNEAIAAYKKAAIKSGWAKVWDGVQKGLYIGVGIGIGVLIH
jgi:uncharacterized protein YlxW (UPF0749 family)